MTPTCLKVDGGIFTDLARVPELAVELEQRGYDACWTGEINHDPFLPLLLAAEHTSRLEVGTSIAVAFARNPMTVANAVVASTDKLAAALKDRCDGVVDRVMPTFPRTLSRDTVIAVCSELRR